LKDQVWTNVDSWDLDRGLKICEFRLFEIRKLLISLKLETVQSVPRALRLLIFAWVDFCVLGHDIKWIKLREEARIEDSVISVDYIQTLSLARQ
jgi:hypothetical protein